MSLKYEPSSEPLHISTTDHLQGASGSRRDACSSTFGRAGILRVCRSAGEHRVGQISEQPLGRNVKRFRGGLVFKAHIWLYHSTLGSRVIKKKKKKCRSAGEQRVGHISKTSQTCVVVPRRAPI